MKYLHSFFLAIFLCFTLSVQASAKSVPLTEAVDLRCNYQVEPLGIDQMQPQFSWRLESDSRGCMQKAYQVLVATSPE